MRGMAGGLEQHGVQPSVGVVGADGGKKDMLDGARAAAVVFGDEMASMDGDEAVLASMALMARTERAAVLEGAIVVCMCVCVCACVCARV